ncbi:MAG: protoheme IX farnesyltransferase [Rhodospirillaceae bacterium]|nr:protoheme IX farnesyltransferase [Rhodospirillaceae bacterium]|tara:strand:- start:592 stop:1524 length:933 start_codon:yes stop_codon:yes gene_type:complete
MVDSLISQTPKLNDHSSAVKSEWFDYFRLLKPRVMSLVVFSGLIGMAIAPGSIHFVTGFIAIISIALGAGAAGAINMWYESDIDALMQRTKNRPIPSGRVVREEALSLGIIVAGAAVIIMGLLVNIVSAILLLLTIAFYVFIYTMLLKRRTSQNIVIGGAAGSLPPVIGWSAVTGSIDFFPILIFTIIFFWTPPHFWALSLYNHLDYKKAGIPMLPVVAGLRKTVTYILIYAFLLLPISIMPWFFGYLGTLYLSTAILLGLIFLLRAVQVLKKINKDANTFEQAAKKLFNYSIFYLFILLLSVYFDSSLI